MSFMEKLKSESLLTTDPNDRYQSYVAHLYAYNATPMGFRCGLLLSCLDVLLSLKRLNNILNNNLRPSKYEGKRIVIWNW